MTKKVTKKKAPAKKKAAARQPRTASKAKTKLEVKSKRAPVVAVTDEQIRARAFQIYRSGRNNDPDADWLQAEQELRAEATT